MNSALARVRSDSANAPARPCPCIAQTVYTHRPQSQLRKRNKTPFFSECETLRLLLDSFSHPTLAVCVRRPFGAVRIPLLMAALSSSWCTTTTAAITSGSAPLRSQSGRTQSETASTSTTTSTRLGETAVRGGTSGTWCDL